MMKTVMSLAIAAACVAFVPSANAQIIQNELVTNGPQASRGDFGDWSARRNVIESRRHRPAFGPRDRWHCGSTAGKRRSAADAPRRLRPVGVIDARRIAKVNRVI